MTFSAVLPPNAGEHELLIPGPQESQCRLVTAASKMGPGSHTTFLHWQLTPSVIPKRN